MQGGRGLAIGGVGAHEAHEGDRPRLGHQPCDVSRPAHVLAARTLVESQVAVEAVAQIVAVEQKRGLPDCEQALLHRAGDR